MPKRKVVPLPAVVEGALDTALDKALSIQRPVIVAYLDRVRDRHRDATPDQIVRGVERRYLAAVAAIGAASGSAAAVPGAGTGVSLASAALEISAFVETTALFALAIAELHGLRIDDRQVRRQLVLAILLGDTGVEAAELAAAESASAWGHVLARGAPEETIRRVNQVIGRHLVARFGTRQGALMLGRALPLGIGAGIGAVGNAALGRGAIAAARRMFGAPPAKLPPRVVDADIASPRQDSPEQSAIEGEAGPR
jgi:hypothetical protein